jgi:hypothetical protein
MLVSPAVKSYNSPLLSVICYLKPGYRLKLNPNFIKDQENEAYFPAKPPEAGKKTWFPVAHGNAQRQGDHQCSSKQGPQAPIRLIA